MKSKSKVAWIFILPTIIIMVGLVFYPILVTFSYSLMDFKLTRLQDKKFVGISNYIEILKSNEFQYAFMNSLIILVSVVILCLVFSLIVSLLLNVDSRINGILTAIAILPWALPPIVNGIIWRWIFYPGYGLINKFLIKMNLIEVPIQWTTNRYTLMIIISIIVAWRTIPFCAIIFLSSLQSIPKELYESASMDGASKVQKFFKITIPLLLPSFAMVLTHTSIGAINVFDEIIALVGYSHIGENLLVYNYNNTFSFMNFGLGSAITYIIMFISGILGIFYIRSMKRERKII